MADQFCGQTNLLTLLAGLARERRIEEGRDLETNLTAELGRKPTKREMFVASIVACEAAFGRTDPSQYSPAAQALLAQL